MFVALFRTHCNFVLILGNPKLHTVLKMRLHQCWAHWDNHFFWPVSYTALDIPQDTVGLLVARAHWWLPSEQSLTKTPLSLSTGLHLRIWLPSLYMHFPLHSPRYKVRHAVKFYMLVNLQHSNLLNISLCKAPRRSRQPVSPPSLVLPANLPKVHFTFVSRYLT